jgi:hypothetical protein
MQVKTNANGNTQFSSAICKGCYAATALTCRPNVGNKLLSAPELNADSLKVFRSDLKALHAKFPEITRLRFYALSDFGPADMPFIYAAKKYFTVDIISKSLTFPHNEKYLRRLLNKKNIWLSLSFNAKFFKFYDRITRLIVRSNNAQVNYALNFLKENPLDKKFDKVSVFHFFNINKRKGLDIHKGLTADRVCAVFDHDGKDVQAHGACDACNNCHVSLADRRRKISAALPNTNTLALAEMQLQ